MPASAAACIRGLPEEVAHRSRRSSPASASTRIMRFAFKLAQSRPRKLLTVVTKSNAQRHGMVMWDEIAAEVAKEFPDVTWDKMLVDAMTVRMTLKPQEPRHHRGDQPARRHPVRSRRRARRLASASRRPPTSTRSAASPRCSSRSTARPSTSPARASPTRSRRSGPAARCWSISARRTPPARLMRAVERVYRRRRAHARCRRQGDDEGSHRRRDRRDPRLERLRERTTSAAKVPPAAAPPSRPRRPAESDGAGR